MAWNRPAANPQNEQKKPSAKPTLKHGIIAGAAVVVIGLAALWIFSGGEDAPKAKVEKKPTRIKEVTPAAATKAVEPAKEDPEDADRKRRAKLAKMTPQERREYVMKKIEETPLDLTPVSNRVYKTGFEQQLSWIFTTRVGDAPPMLLQIPPAEKAHLAEILLNRVDPANDDSDAVLESKEVVEAAKKEIRSYIKEGGNVEDFLQYYHDKLTQSFRERNEAQSSVYEVIRNDPGIAVDYINKVNARLAEKGIAPVKIAKHIAERIGYKPETNPMKGTEE